MGGSFSLAIPGGSVVAALAKLEPDAIDYSKVNVFLCNEKIPSLPCISGAVDVLSKVGVPKNSSFYDTIEMAFAAMALRFRTTRRSRAGAARGGGTQGARSRASGSAHWQQSGTFRCKIGIRSPCKQR